MCSGGDHLGGATEEGVRERLGKGGGYGSGLGGIGWRLLGESPTKAEQLKKTKLYLPYDIAGVP